MACVRGLQLRRVHTRVMILSINYNACSLLALARRMRCEYLKGMLSFEGMLV